MAKKKITLNDEVVVYYSADDGCWIAHSLHTDQIGTGDRIVDSMAALVRGISAILKLAEADETIAFLREAPARIQKLARSAKALPLEVYEVAHKMATGRWPKYLTIEVTADSPETPLKAAMPELTV